MALGEFTSITCEVEAEPAFRLHIDPLLQLRAEALDQLSEWMRDKGLEKEAEGCAVFDPRSNRMYPIDLIASKHGRAYLIILLHTRRRIPRTRHAQVLLYANEVHGVCVEQYAMSPTTIVINVYFKGQAEGGGTGVSAISRPSAGSSWSSSSSEGGVTARRFRPTRVEMA